MTYIFDTNIIFTSLYNSQFNAFIESKYRQPSDDVIISAVTIGELKALALKRNWGMRRKEELFTAISQFLVYPIKVQQIIDNYAVIYAYSQSKLVDNPLPKGLTARNMGKNDLWIAATAHTIKAKLITTDKDFDHLNFTYLDLECVSIKDFI